MLLIRRLRACAGSWKSAKSPVQDAPASRAGRTFYDIPSYFNAIRHHYKVNEEVPEDAVDFPLTNITIQQFDDTSDFNKIPKLHHGLNKLLDGKVYMGDMGFGKLPELNKQLIEQMSDYKPPSQDKHLMQISKQNKCKYYSSTSNISIPMIHLYFLFSMFRRPNFDNVYENNPSEAIKREHMNHFKKPATFYLTRTENDKRGTYSIDSDKGYSEEKTNEVLLQFGTFAEYLLTHSPSTINKMLQSKVVEEKPDSYYRYCTLNKNLMLRSQIDCRDIDENGNPFVFQIKTRAAAPIRYDVQNWKLYLDYPINKMRGYIQSFQREYYDLVRGAFIKYALQLKIGRMSGAFVAYHNTQSIYGYEYVSFKEMVLRLFGDQYNMDVSFSIISKMMTEIFDYVLEDTKQYDYNQLKIGFYANSITKSLNVIVQVMNEVKSYPSILNRDSVQQYFQKYVKQLKNPVIKYDFSFYTFLNNVLVRHPQIYYSPADNITMKWKAKKLGRIQIAEYVQFLREAYKEDFVFGSSRYYGHWSDVEEIKEWC